MEKRKENQECEKRKTIAKEKHKQWVQRKNEEVKRVNAFIFSLNFVPCFSKDQLLCFN